MSFYTVQVQPPVLNWSDPPTADPVAFGGRGIIIASRGIRHY
jgi:hypothetical protein